MHRHRQHSNLHGGGSGLYNRIFLALFEQDGGSTWVQEKLGISSGSFNSTSCTGTGSTAVCTAVGTPLFESPLLSVSTNAGESWFIVDTGSENGVFESTSCTGRGESAICTAVGQLYPNDTTSQPLLYVSRDGGSTWNSASAGITDDGNFQSTSCTGKDISAICTAVGNDNTTGLPWIYFSTDEARTWNAASIGITDPGYFNSVSCTGEGFNAICTATGYDYSTGISLLYVSHDGGNTWSPAYIIGPGLQPSSSLRSASCTGEGNTAICAAAGSGLSSSFTPLPPLLYVSIDGARTWSQVSTGQTKALLIPVSCTGRGDKAICVAAGQDTTTNLPLVFNSPDGGKTWSSANTGVTNIGVFNATSCTDTDRGAICTVVGQDQKTNLPLLYRSTDGGRNWSAVYTGITSQASFDSTSCSCEDGITVCTAAGGDLTTGLPLLYFSIDNTIIWSPANTGVSNGGSYNDTAAE